MVVGNFSFSCSVACSGFVSNGGATSETDFSTGSPTSTSAASSVVGAGSFISGGRSLVSACVEGSSSRSTPFIILLSSTSPVISLGVSSLPIRGVGPGVGSPIVVSSVLSPLGGISTPLSVSWRPSLGLGKSVCEPSMPFWPDSVSFSIDGGLVASVNSASAGASSWSPEGTEVGASTGVSGASADSCSGCSSGWLFLFFFLSFLLFFFDEVAASKSCG